MFDKKKHPLVVIDSELMIRIMYQAADKTVLYRVRCPHKNDYCTVKCPAVCLVEYQKRLALSCFSNGQGFPIGILDLETVDVDIIDMLRWGSNLLEAHLRG
jgi:hypothetical protein